MKIIIANDHAATELKEEICIWLKSQGHQVTDLGAKSGEKADYPDKGREAAEMFMKGSYDHGILCCGTGNGISISANKVKGIRCALPQNIFAAKMAKEHNHCQFIAFGSRIDYQDEVSDMLEAFLNASNDVTDRHKRRVRKIMAIEN